MVLHDGMKFEGVGDTLVLGKGIDLVMAPLLSLVDVLILEAVKEDRLDVGAMLLVIEDWKGGT